LDLVDIDNWLGVESESVDLSNSISKLS
jgi:hypothetical protein